MYWALVTFFLVVAGFAGLGNGHAIGLAGIALGALAAIYDYGIWTCKARHLTIFFII